MKKILKALLFSPIFLFAAHTSHCEEFYPVEPVVGENFTNPLGFDLSGLSFSWKLPPLRAGMAQSAYRIIASRSERGLEGSPIWDSGKVESSQNRNIKFGGGELNSRQRVYWKVIFWDERGDVSEWSHPQWFETGLLSNSDWKGKWISSADAPKDVVKKIKSGGKNQDLKRKWVQPAYLRKGFSTNQKEIKSARLYLASHGWFQTYINGEKVGDDYLGTGWTEYGKHVQSNTYDVTNLLRNGENAIGAIIADGWYSGYMSWDNANAYGVKPEILMQLEITFKDDSVQVITTDETWKYSNGALLSADIYDGEVYDARLEFPHWNEKNFDDSAWKNVATVQINKNEKILPRRDSYVKKIMKLKPLSVKETQNGVFQFDMGQNMVGWVKIKIPSSSGREVTINFAEMLEKDGSLYNANYRSAISQDKYICASYGTEEWEPNFTFHGFRYVEISGLPADTKASVDMVEGIVLGNEMKVTGNFVCSHPKVNALQSNIQWGQRGNFLSVPTDCPQRDERLGWTGDAQIFCSTAAYNMDVSAFFSKWLFDLRMSQKADGCVGDVVPLVLKSKWSNSSHSAWSDAAIVIPYKMYLDYGDKKVLEQSYESMKKYVDFIVSDFDKSYGKSGYGDWLEPFAKATTGSTPIDLIACAHVVYDSQILSKTAAILGQLADAKKYAELADAFRERFRKNYISENGEVKSSTQTAYLMALNFGIVQGELKEKVFANFLKSIKSANNHLRTGFVGTYFLLSTLSENGRPDLAQEIFFKETYPSWIYSINQGATTIWERWNSYSHDKGFGDVGMNSFNHYAYGAVGEWIYKSIGGLSLDESAAGYEKIIFAPDMPLEKMTFASAMKETPNGFAKSEWKFSDGVVEWQVVIPPNSSGTVVFPTSNIKSIRINGNVVDKSKFSMLYGRPAILGMKSGTYRMLMKIDTKK